MEDLTVIIDVNALRFGVSFGEYIAVRRRLHFLG